MSVRTDGVKTAAPKPPAAPAEAPARIKMPEQTKMVGWYDPLQLARTGVEVAVSTLFGRHSDQRQIEALTSGDTDVYDYTFHYTDDGDAVCVPDETRPRDSIWIDYVGDVGDGFNSTYAVAYHLAHPTRPLAYRDPRTGESRVAETRRGELLVFGGDQVYPTASRDEYERRLIQPYSCALRETKPPPCPHVFAIPGNHDWYDSLVSFTRYFNSSRRWFGGWRTRQDRSYFALKLPHNWWLLGTDVQLGSDIDKAQMEYFVKAAEQMKEAEAVTGQPARIILCNAEPDWIFAAQYKGIDPTYSERNLRVLEKRLGRKVAVFIAGDLHHYRRHEATDGSGTQKITAGGGGAFLHPTHPGRRGPDLSTIEDDDGRQFRMTKCFPPAEESSRLTWRNLFFPYLKNNASRTFGFVTALLYLLTTLHHVGDVGDVEHTSYRFGSLVGLALNSFLSSPATMFCVTLTVLGFFFFTDTHSRLHRFVMGGLHALAHILAAFAIAMLVLLVVSGLMSDAWVVPFSLGQYHFTFDPRMLVAALLIMAGGFVVGPFILGLYLLASLNYFGRHSNEAFSSLAVEDWKHFLRMHINERGDLTIYPVGLRRVPRAWKRREGGGGPELVPDDPAATAPELIEPPVVLKSAASQTGVVVASANGHGPAGNGPRADA
jgi:Calcineurin-like phosphoesterase